jgi:hypothetical protein
VEERATNVEECLARVLPFVREAPWEDIDLSIQTGGEPRGRGSRLRPLEAVREAGMQEHLLAGGGDASRFVRTRPARG